MNIIEKIKGDSSLSETLKDKIDNELNKLKNPDLYINTNADGQSFERSHENMDDLYLTEDDSQLNRSKESEDEDEDDEEIQVEKNQPTAGNVPDGENPNDAFDDEDLDDAGN